MNAATSQNENRRSCRLPAGEPARGELELADRSRWPVSIIDQSAGGLGLLTDELPPIACGDIVQFRTEESACEARIVHLNNREPAGNSVEFPSAPGYRVGLVRIRDVSINPDDDGGDNKRVRLRFPIYDFGFSPIAVIGVVVAVAVVVGVATSAVFSIGSGQDSRTNSRKDATDSASGSRQQRSLSSDANGPSKEAVAPSRRNSEIDSERQDLKHLHGALPFVMTSVNRELALSDTQLEQIRRIIEDTDQAIATNQESRLLMDGARRQALGVLTDAQRRRWAALSGADASKGQ